MGLWLWLAGAVFAQQPAEPAAQVPLGVLIARASSPSASAPERLEAALAVASRTPSDRSVLALVRGAAFDVAFEDLDAHIERGAESYRTVAWSCDGVEPAECVRQGLESAKRQWHQFEARGDRYVSMMRLDDDLRIAAGTWSVGARVQVAMRTLEVRPVTPALDAALSVGAGPKSVGPWDKLPLPMDTVAQLRELPALWHPVAGLPDDPHITVPCEGKDNLKIRTATEGLYRTASIWVTTPVRPSGWTVAAASREGSTWSLTLPSMTAPDGELRVEVEYPYDGNPSVSKWTGWGGEPQFYATPGSLERRVEPCD